ncbi:MAG: NAD-dependent epimerase/dehydratase family protein [Flavobacterium sp.]|nr:NAD-dependent epimerase/dehydratase family protein [Flavobacterium sp.]
MILLTGATGLVGAHAALHLIEKGEKVRALYRTAESIQKTRSLFKIYEREQLVEQIEWVQGDITDVPSLELAVAGIDQVWHCAAMISFDRRDEEKLRKANIEGTANLVNLSLAHSVTKFCYVSSIAALGDPLRPEDFVDEETEWNPERHHSDYAITKHGAEMEVWRAQQEGLPSVIISPGVILGPGFWNRGSGEIFSTIADDLPFYTQGSTGFVAVTDVVDIMYKLMQSEISGQRFAVIAQNIIYRDLAFYIADELAVSRPTINAKPWMTEIAWIADYILSPIIRTKRKLYRDTARLLHDRTYYSNEKITAELNYNFTDIQSYIEQVVSLQKRNTIT